MDFWLTMEIQDGAFSAQSWRRSHSESLVEAAVTNGVQDWTWRQLIWGVVLELQFADESARDRFKDFLRSPLRSTRYPTRCSDC
jgi:hypothetical protein